MGNQLAKAKPNIKTKRTGSTLQLDPSTDPSTDSPLPNLYPQQSSRIDHATMAKFQDMKVNNGVTGTFISTRICAIIYTFWTNHLSLLMQEQKHEIGCAIFFGMIAINKSIKQIIYKHSKTDPNKIELMSIKFLDMLGWIIRSLMKDGIDLYGSLKQLGLFHQNIGVCYKHFDPMLQSMHESFSYYFERGYSFEVKYAMDEVFILIASIMMGEDKNNTHLSDITNLLHENNIQFLQSLDVCLVSDVGREYFVRYLQQTWCHEIAMWLQSINRFRKAMNDKERFFIARNIVKVSIKSSSTFSINISYYARCEILNGMKIMQQRFAMKEKLDIKSDFFEKIEREMVDLIEKNHWMKFVSNMNKLKAACSSGTLANPSLDDI
eukprot:452824_1